MTEEKLKMRCRLCGQETLHKKQTNEEFDVFYCYGCEHLYGDKYRLDRNGKRGALRHSGSRA